MKYSTLTLMLAGAVFVAGCNSSGSSSSDDNGDSDDAEIGGILIAPEQSADADAKILERARTASRSEDSCGGTVPSGYERIANTDISFFDDADNKVGDDISSDDCGIFRTADRPDARRMFAEPQGRRPINTDVDMFRRSSGDSDDEMTIVSTIDENAEYEIRSLFRQSDGRLGFTVADTETGRPVIGLPAGAFTLEDQSGNEVPLDGITSGSQSRESASVSLVLDASGSMGFSSAFIYEDEDGNRHYRYHVARDASHLFLNEKGADDEAAVMIFDNKVDMVNDDLLADHFDLRDEDDQETTYTFSESGFTTEEEPLRLAIDLFDPHSQIYDNPFSGYQPEVHPNTPDLSIASSYRWDGSTALFQAVYEAVDATEERANSRKAVVTMGDGANNTGNRNLQETIDHANSLGIPLYSIALGVTEGSRGYDDLKELADETGGDFVHVEDDGAETKLLSAFESIQIGLVYQYLATLTDNDDIQQGDTVVLKLDHNELEAERAFTVPASGGNGDDD